MPLEARAATEPVLLRLSTGFDSAITDVDAGFSRLTGWPRDEALGQTVAILFGPWSDRAVVDRVTRAVERGEDLEPLPVKLYGYTGNVFDAMVAVAPDGAGGVTCRLDANAGVADVVHRASGDESRDVVAPAPDRLLPVLIEILNDGVAVVDEDERIVAANGVFARMVGHAAEDLAGMASARVMELRFPPGDTETLGAAVFTAPEATARAAAVTTGRGIDHRGRPFRVYTFRASAAAAQPRPDSPLEARTEVFEQTLAKKVERGGLPVAVGMLEIVADDEMARNLGSIWRDTLERARLAATAALAGELRPGEIFAAVRSDTVLVLLLESHDADDALGRMHAIAQVARHRLIGEGGAIASLEAFGAAVMIDPGSEVMATAHGNAPGQFAERLVEMIRGHQGGEHQIETIIADILDEGMAVTRPVRGRDLGPARQSLCGFDDRSARWLAWLGKRHMLTPALEREFDVALVGRVVERLLAGEDPHGVLVLPVHHDSFSNPAAADRLTAMVTALPTSTRMRLHILLRDLPADLVGERLLVAVRKIATIGRGVWLVLDGLDNRGVQGRQEGVAGFALDHARLGPLIEREPRLVKEFIERLRAGNLPVLVFGVETPEQARLLFSAFGVTLVAGRGAERLSAAPRAPDFEA